MSAGGGQSILPMGSSYELALQLFFDVVCILLQKRVKQDEGQMTSRHTNLE